MNDQWTDKLSEYLDGELDADETQALEQHLEDCEACRGILHELQQVMQRAHTLPDHLPNEDLWEAIAARIESRPIEIPEPRRGARPVRSTSSAARGTSSENHGMSAAMGGASIVVRGRTVMLPLPQLIAACLLVMVVSGAIGWYARPSGEGNERQLIPSGSILAQEGSGPVVGLEPVDDGLWRESGNELAAVRWEEAVNNQEAVYRQMRAQIDTTTVRVLEKNLGLLDRSIDEIREAREDDPENPLWNNRLADNLRRKLRLLRWASSISTRET